MSRPPLPRSPAPRRGTSRPATSRPGTSGLGASGLGATRPFPPRPASRRPRPVALPRLVPTPRADPPYDDEPGDVSGEVPPGPATPRGAAVRPPEPMLGPLVLGPPGSRPDARRLRALGQAVAEVLAGVRPAAAVTDRFTGRAYAELVRAGTMLRTRRPPRTGLPHVHQPHDGAIEMCVLVNCGDRNHVLALRLERRGVQWLCTEFETA